LVYNFPTLEEFAARGVGFGVGGPSGGPFVTHDGGVTWTDTRPFDLAAYRVTFVDNSHGWALDGNSLLNTDDGGASWHRIYPPGGK